MKILKIAQLDPNAYVAEVDVNLYGYPDNYLVEANKVAIKFGIDIEARDWGIKGITVFVYDQILEIPITITDTATETQQEKVIQVVAKNIKRYSYGETGIITLDKMDLWVDANFNVDYRKSMLDVNMP